MSGARSDVIVVGLGHAGCEAALACARMGLSVLAVTLRADRIGLMSCNPAVGGTGKGQLVRELDALGGEMGKVADATGTHFRRLNGSKGPAVRATRVLCDRAAYCLEMTRRVRAQRGIEIVEGEVKGLLREGGRVLGVSAGSQEYLGKAVVVTAGTFLQGLMHVGEEKSTGGRAGDVAAVGLSESLRSAGLTLGRFKTGTPARLDRRSIDFARTERQAGDEVPHPLSFATRPQAGFPRLRQLDCAITFTNAATHAVVRANLGRSPLYRGEIVGRGPRYCPSLEDKVVRFGHRERHTVFLEPDGVVSDVVYPAGVSTSLPADVQREFLRTIAGLEEVRILLPGYAVEYDFVPPTQLRPTLQARGVEGLYLAGQVNGTSGYEEAAVQGFFAGVNAGLWIQGRPAMELQRSESLIGVLLDDLVTKGTDEPYRIFTSRAEHRLLLREGNADLRLSRLGRELGLVREEEWTRVVGKRLAIEEAVAALEAAVVNPDSETVAAFQLRGWGSLRAPTSLASLVRRPEVGLHGIGAMDERFRALEPEVAEEVETQVLYGGYIARQEEWVRRSKSLEETPIPADFPYRKMVGFSQEVVERLERVRPATLGQAGRLPGMTPAALGLLAVQVARRRCG